MNEVEIKTEKPELMIRGLVYATTISVPFWALILKIFHLV